LDASTSFVDISIITAGRSRRECSRAHLVQGITNCMDDLYRCSLVSRTKFRAVNDHPSHRNITNIHKRATLERIPIRCR